MDKEMQILTEIMITLGFGKIFYDENNKLTYEDYRYDINDMNVQVRINKEVIVVKDFRDIPEYQDEINQELSLKYFLNYKDVIRFIEDL